MKIINDGVLWCVLKQSGITITTQIDWLFSSNSMVWKLLFLLYHGHLPTITIAAYHVTEKLESAKFSEDLPVVERLLTITLLLNNCLLIEGFTLSTIKTILW